MSFSFVFASLVVLCLLVSLVYAMTSCDVLETIVKETLWSFMLMLGGICLLAVIVMVLPGILAG